MSLKFYYDLMCQPSRAIYIILRMSGVQFEDCRVSLLTDEHLTQTYRENVNRFQRVPCIVDGDYRLGESIAVLRYLSAKGKIPECLYPKYFVEQARVDEFLEWQHTTLRITTGLFYRTVWLFPLKNGKRASDEKIERLRKRMEENLDIVENVWLKNTDYLTGNKLTVADIFAACEIEQLRIADYDVRGNYPKIRDWLERTRRDCLPHYDTAHQMVYQITRTESQSKL